MPSSDKARRKAFRHLFSAWGLTAAIGTAPVWALPSPVVEPPVFFASRQVAFNCRQSVGLPIIEPMHLLEIFSKLAPMVGGPIVFELRRKHPVLGDRQVAGASDVLSIAETLDGAGLGLADLAAIKTSGPAGQVDFQVDLRRLEILGTETFVAFAMPVMDQMLYTSPLEVTLAGAPARPVLQVHNRGADAWLITEVRLGERRSQRLSKPLAGRVKSNGTGVTFSQDALSVGVDSYYEGLIAPGGNRSFALEGSVPSDGSVPINLVAYRLNDPVVLAGLYLRPQKDETGQAFKAVEPPWEQWQSSPLLVLGPWPPALIVLRQVQFGDRTAGR